jgi:hypothetical protein
MEGREGNMMDYLQNLPAPEALLHKYRQDRQVPEVNGHLHSPNSFCAFNSIGQMFQMAVEEGVKVLGINDFYTVDGYDEFVRAGQQHRIFPLFNIEFMGLMQDMQAQDILINDPNNPGRTYFSGKALKHPLSVSNMNGKFLEDLQQSSQIQVKEMISKAGAHLRSINARFNITYEQIREKYANKLVRERHIARAIREAVMDHYPAVDQVYSFFMLLFDGKKLSTSLDDASAVENEIRSVLLKAGGKAFVPEDNDAFPELRKIIDFILDAGGIPCYPVLLDDRNGNLTEFEGDWDRMDEVLQSFNVSCLELIPLRNSLERLEEFVDYFRRKKYVMSFGTEHNSPGLFPITVKVDRDKALTTELKKVSYEGCCVLAAHQYLVARGQEGFIDSLGRMDIDNQDYYMDLGNAIIKEFTL